MSDIIKLLTNPELAFASQVELVNLINSLILENRSLHDRLPWEVQKYLGANVYGVKIIQHTNKDDLLAKTILGQSNLNHDVKQLLQVLQSLVETNKSLKTHMKAVEEDHKKKEQDRLNLIASAISGSTGPTGPTGSSGPTGPSFIELKNSKGDYNTNIINLVGKQLNDVYGLLVEAIDHIHQNQSFFKDLTGAVLSVANKDNITIRHINEAIQENETNKVSYLTTILTSGLSLYDAKKYLLLYTKILYMLIVYYFYVKAAGSTGKTNIQNIRLNIFSNRIGNAQFNNVINNSKDNAGILTKIDSLKIHPTATVKIDLSTSTETIILKETAGSRMVLYYSLRLPAVSDFANDASKSLILAGGGQDKYHAKYIKYKTKYQQLKTKLQLEGLI